MITMADDEQLYKEHNFGDASEGDKNSSPSPPPKKHKVDEESHGTEVEEEDEQDAVADDDEGDEGFDIYHYPGPGPCWAAQYTPLNVDDNSSCTVKDLIELSNVALSKLNQKEDANYRLEKVEKANAQLWDVGANYYITFQAKDSVANSFETFQALVWQGPKWNISEPPVLKLFRRKPAVAT